MTSERSALSCLSDDPMGKILYCEYECQIETGNLEN